MNDTSPAAAARYTELLAAQPPYKRLAQACSLSSAVRDLAVAGIRLRHPGATDHEVRVRLTVLLYGRDVGRRLFSSIPDDAI